MVKDPTRHVRGDRSTMVGVDKRWRERVVKDDRMPVRFKMTRREFKEYKKNMGEKMTKRANQGLPIYRGARVDIKG